MSRRKRKNSPVAMVCGALGTALLVLLIVICLPLTVPQMLGDELYTVISGSMEPAIPVGSLVYIRKEAPESIQAEDVIAFYGAKDSNAIITHRVVENQVIMGEFTTKGDANEKEDMNPVPYENYIGKVALSILGAGVVAQFITSTPGKIAAACVIVLAVVLQVMASVLKRR